MKKSSSLDRPCSRGIVRALSTNRDEARRFAHQQTSMEQVELKARCDLNSEIYSIKAQLYQIRAKTPNLSDIMKAKENEAEMRKRQRRSKRTYEMTEKERKAQARILKLRTDSKRMSMQDFSSRRESFRRQSIGTVATMSSIGNITSPRTYTEGNSFEKPRAKRVSVSRSVISFQSDGLSKTTDLDTKTTTRIDSALTPRNVVINIDKSDTLPDITSPRQSDYPSYGGSKNTNNTLFPDNQNSTLSWKNRPKTGGTIRSGVSFGPTTITQFDSENDPRDPPKGRLRVRPGGRVPSATRTDSRSLSSNSRVGHLLARFNNGSPYQSMFKPELSTTKRIERVEKIALNLLNVSRYLDNEDTKESEPAVKSSAAGSDTSSDVSFSDSDSVF